MTTNTATAGADSAAAPTAAARAAKYISLLIFRKSGAGVATPVWFAPAGDRLYIGATAHSGKVKRIRNGGRVLIAPCTARGEVTGRQVEARARILPPAGRDLARRALRRRGAVRARLGDLFYRLRRWEHAFLEITPT